MWTSDADAIWANMAADQPLLTEEVPAGTTDPATTDPAGPDTTAPDATAPTPAQTKTPGKEAFTVDHTTAVC